MAVRSRNLEHVLCNQPCLTEASGNFTNLFMITIQGLVRKEKQSDSPDYFYIGFRMALKFDVSILAPNFNTSWKESYFG